MDGIRQALLAWYGALGSLQGALADPVRLLADQWNVPALSALLFGLLGSVSPCQVTANVSAMAYVSGRAGEGRPAWGQAAAFVWGKVVAYTLLGGLAIALGFRLPPWAMAGLRKAFGPVMLLLGLHLLGAVRLRWAGSAAWLAGLERRLAGRGGAGAFLLGVAYSLVFCPTMALLFFGLLVPLGLRVNVGVLLPAFFAVGTAAPLLAFTLVLAAGSAAGGPLLRRFRRADRFVRVAAGVVFLLAGIHDTLLYWVV